MAADAFPLKWAQGDFLLLCSDGLINTVSDQELLFEVIHSEPLDTCLDRLLALSVSGERRITSLLCCL